MRFVAVCCFLVLSIAGSAFGQQATVTKNAPIFVRQDPGGLSPLRVAAVGTVLKVVGEEGEWIQVQFQDPQWGLRTGWVKKEFLKIDRPELQPMDLSVREPAAVTRGSVQRGRTTESVATSMAPDSPQQPATRQPLDAAPERYRRQGFWFNVGLGFGSLGCQDCVVRDNGLSGGLSLGGAINDKLLLGVGTTGFAKSVAGELLTVGTVDARLRFYPARSSGFFITGGLGIGSVSFAGESEIGVGAVLGLGWDIAVSRRISLTPFWNGFAMSNSTTDANVGQFGLGVTIH